jgi:beta-glucanase (GH16 family)
MTHSLCSKLKDAVSALILLSVGSSTICSGQTPGSSRVKTPRVPRPAASGFTISASPKAQTVTPGHTASYAISIDALRGFAGSVSLQAHGLPAGAIAKFNPDSLRGAGKSTLTVSTIAAVEAGTFELTILAASERGSENATITLVQPWRLAWNDEFDGPDGSAPDASKWNIEKGGNGWGTGEIECYTNDPRNVRVENGNLAITAIRETVTCSDGSINNYTSARLNTRRKLEQLYGRFESRIRIPSGQGVFPAFWMLGDSANNCGAKPWPSCGEIDIIENIGREPSIIHSGIHGPGYSSGPGGSFTLPEGEAFSAAFHVFALEWESSEAVSFYVDDTLFKTIRSADLPSGTSWIFNHPADLLVNFAVGGNWPHPPDSTAVFPQTMLVDYVRVFARAQ